LSTGLGKVLANNGPRLAADATDEPERWVSAKADVLASNAWARYGISIALTIVALAVRWLLDPVFGDRVPYSFLYATVAFSAIYLGVGPSVLGAVLGLAATDVLFVAPRGSLGLYDVPHGGEAITYIGLCALIVTAGEVNRRSKLRIKTAHEELAQRQEALHRLSEQLEERVVERTAELRRAEESARQLGAQVLKMQDDERRRIARELHDSVGQMIALLQIDAGRLQRSPNLGHSDIEVVSEIKQLSEDVSHEIRTISHLLHPPLLDELGVPSALAWYIDQFSKRSGIASEVELAKDFGRLPPDYEIAIFRIVQEALTNVHRHSGSQQVAVRLKWSADVVKVEIADRGKGIPPEKQQSFATGAAMGVGLRGMRERVAQLDGALEVKSGASGTVVSATFPVETSGAAAAVSSGSAVS
jgi:signal transduction histidine kinase